LKPLVRLVARIRNVEIQGFDRRSRSPGFDLVAAEGAILESGKPWALAAEGHIGDELSLNIWRVNSSFPPSYLNRRSLEISARLHAGNEFGREVAHLIGVGHQHELWFFVAEELVQRGGECVGRVGIELG